MHKSLICGHLCFTYRQTIDRVTDKFSTTYQVCQEWDSSSTRFIYVVILPDLTGCCGGIC
jgi:hypothetical protein